MNSQDLLEALKDDARQIVRSYPGELERLRATAGEGDDPASAVAAYDYLAFNELLGQDKAPPGIVDEGILAGFREQVDRYMDAYAPGNVGFKDYIRTVSAYLAFVARRPLHPPGLRFSGDEEIALVDGTWRCPGKRIYAGDPASLCKYCVCSGD